MSRVLMVDDDGAMLFAFRKLCAASDISADTADSLETALKLLSQERFDILISDLNLTGAGGQEGFEIVRAAKRSNPSIRAYIWTAYDKKQSKEMALAMGVEAYLTKPVKFENLLSIINEQAMEPTISG